MFCIAAFIFVLIMAAVSAKYRKLVKKAWNCAFRRVTFRACDSTFKQDAKAEILGPIAVRAPRLVRPASITLEVLAWIFVVTTVISLYIVVRSGLNLVVYGTCNVQNAASCSLGAEACSVQTGTPGFLESVGKGDVIGAFSNEFHQFGETVSGIPARLRHWDAKEYAPTDATYLKPYDPKKPTALEIVDPGCQFCALTTRNIRDSKFADHYNVTYIPYPIGVDGKYKFANSVLTTQYLQALRTVQAQGSLPKASTPYDWQLLETVFLGKTNGVGNQIALNNASHAEATNMLKSWLRTDGLNDKQLAQVASIASSPEVQATIKAQRKLVTDTIKTVKIPTIIFDGVRHNGLVTSDELEHADGMPKN